MLLVGNWKEIVNYIDKHHCDDIKEEMLNTCRAHYLNKMNDKIDKVKQKQRAKLRADSKKEIKQRTAIKELWEKRPLSEKEKAEINADVMDKYNNATITDFIYFDDMPDSIRDWMIGYYNAMLYKTSPNGVEVKYKLPVKANKDNERGKY